MADNRNDNDWRNDRDWRDRDDRSSERNFRDRGYNQDYGSDRGYGDQGRMAGGYRSEWDRDQNRSFGDRSNQDRGYSSSYGGSYGSSQNRGGYDQWSRQDRDVGASRDAGRSFDRSSDFGSAYGERDFGARDLGTRSYRDSTFGNRSYDAGSERGDYGYGQANRSFGDRAYGGGERGYAEGGRRGFWDKAADEVSSWFGDQDAERRRENDQHRGKGPKNYARSDDRIRDDINDRLSDDGWIDASDIEVAVKDREVTLTGTVTDRHAKRRAEDLAEDVSGVNHVQNNLRVKSQSTGTGFGSTASATSDVTVDRSTTADASTGLGSTTGMTVAKPAAGGAR